MSSRERLPSPGRQQICAARASIEAGTPAMQPASAAPCDLHAAVHSAVSPQSARRPVRRRDRSPTSTRDRRWRPPSAKEKRHDIAASLRTAGAQTRRRPTPDASAPRGPAPEDREGASRNRHPGSGSARVAVRPRLLRLDRVRRDRRPLGARRDRALHRGPVADGVDRRLHGLGGASRLLARASSCSSPRRRSRRRLRLGNYAGRRALRTRRRRALHRAAAAGPALRRPRPGAARRTTSSTRRSCSTQQWWHNATTGVRGVTRQHENMVAFATRQLLDVFSPSNFAARPTPRCCERTLRRRRA